MSTRANVVLPLPDSPTRPSVSPGLSSTSMSTSPWISCPSMWKVFETWVALISGLPLLCGAAAACSGLSSRSGC